MWSSKTSSRSGHNQGKASPTLESLPRPSTALQRSREGRCLCRLIPFSFSAKVLTQYTPPQVMWSVKAMGTWSEVAHSLWMWSCGGAPTRSNARALNAGKP